jgi:hypothetical protein
MTYEKIKQIIDTWDPIGLLAMDCPEDEYEPEIKELFARLNTSLSADKTAKIVYDVFIEMFGADTFTEELSKCKEIALQILS